MDKLKSILRDVGYCTVGIAAVIVEAGTKTAQALVRKGEATLRENQDTVEDLKRRAKELGDKFKDSFEKPAASEPGFDTSRMSAEERAELRRQLDEADAACTACDSAATDGETEAEADDETASQPVAPDAIYHAGEPVEPISADSEEDPEEGVNG